MRTLFFLRNQELRNVIFKSLYSWYLRYSGIFVTWIGSCLHTFQDNLSVSPLGVKQSKTGKICCHQESVNNYKSAFCKIPDLIYTAVEARNLRRIIRILVEDLSEKDIFYTCL